MDVQAPTLVTFDDHLCGLRAATDAFARAAGLSWLGARVPTCPEWDLLDLIAHQGMVHRWAMAAVTGHQAAMGNATLMETEGRTAADPLAWLQTGAEDLARALEEAAPDLDTLVFLPAAPAPKQFWARRQCHETTMHALDAVAAERGRVLTDEDVWFGPDLAADGVDELVLGFWPRGRNALRSEDPYAVTIRATDLPIAWRVEVSDTKPRSTRLVDGPGGTNDDTSTPVIAGTAVDLYLALWHRGGAVSDDDHVLDRWREQTRVMWTAGAAK